MGQKQNTTEISKTELMMLKTAGRWQESVHQIENDNYFREWMRRECYFILGLETNDVDQCVVDFARSLESN